MTDWIKKIAGYAPDIAMALSTGGSSLAVTGLRILSKELLGVETGSEQQLEQAVKAATPDQLLALTKCNNEFKLDKMQLENDSKQIDTQDLQSEHLVTQQTIRQGDNSDSKLVRYTRPLQSWLSLCAAIGYCFTADSPSIEVLGALMTLPTAYFGLRQVGKWKTASTLAKITKPK